MLGHAEGGVQSGKSSTTEGQVLRFASDDITTHSPPDPRSTSASLVLGPSHGRITVASPPQRRRQDVDVGEGVDATTPARRRRGLRGGSGSPVRRGMTISNATAAQGTGRRLHQKEAARQGASGATGAAGALVERVKSEQSARIARADRREKGGDGRADDSHAPQSRS